MRPASIFRRSSWIPWIPRRRPSPTVDPSTIVTQTITDSIGITDEGSFDVLGEGDRIGITDTVTYQTSSGDLSQTITDSIGISDYGGATSVEDEYQDNIGITDSIVQSTSSSLNTIGIKIAGTVVQKPIYTKIGGSLVNKPVQT